MKTILPFVGALLLCGCAGNGGAKSDKQMISVAHNVITVSENASVLEKLKTEKVAKSPYQPQFSASGMVKAIPTSYAEIATPFAGRIVRSFVRLGQSVSVGSPLFEISSPAFFDAGKAYFAAKQEMEQALKSLTREKDLLANRVGVAKDVEESQVDYELKKQEYENAQSALKVFQVDPAKLNLGEPLVVRSPIAGKVVTNNIVIGQYIKEDSEPLTVVADLNKVWVVAHVKEKHIPLIEQLQQVEIRLSASPDEPISGKVYHISDMLDEATRSVEVIIECDNKSGRMRPFMYGTVVLTDAIMDAILVPNAAVLQQENNSYVIVKVGDRKFRKTQVQVASTSDDRSVVTAGLNPDEEIVSQGAFYFLDAK